MQIPEFWAEVRLEGKVDERKRVVRRFGWSESSQAEAQQHAKERADAALEELRAGRKVPHRERKLAYGNAGLPIREEVIARNGSDVVTRNSYGARCLNEPDVLFADVDFERSLPGWQQRLLGAVGCNLPLLLVALAVVAAVNADWLETGAYLIAALLLLIMFIIALSWLRYRPGAQDEKMKEHVRAFISSQAGCRFALYETPKGLRLLALHRTFDPRSEEVQAMFRELDGDPAYAQMCALQACFRARVSPKPWRIGIQRPPSSILWPVPDNLHRRRQNWVARYETAANEYAACRFVEELGDGRVDPRCREVQRMHDEMCRARSELPIA